MTTIKPDLKYLVELDSDVAEIWALELEISSLTTMIGHRQQNNNRNSMNLQQRVLVTTMRILTKLFFRVHIDDVSKITTGVIAMMDMLIKD